MNDWRRSDRDMPPEDDRGYVLVWSPLRVGEDGLAFEFWRVRLLWQAKREGKLIYWHPLAPPQGVPPQLAARALRWTGD